MLQPRPDVPLGLNAEVDVQELVRRAQANDRLAFGELYELYCPKIYTYMVYHLNGRVDLAEDLTAEVFMKALQSLGHFQFREVPFSAWLYRIAHNHLIDHIRRLPKQQPVSMDDCPHLDVEDSENPDRRLDRQALSAALKRLTEEQRRIVVMRIVQGMSIAETARAMGKSEDSVKQLQSRGLKALKRILMTEGAVA
ncbi:MAG: RNA polymerase sigma factor [Chloroflexota bacterium]